ncbi:hypothetical protein CPter91_3036 [Collimonas pratensis]|uniref:Uncharacterized protein n=1 Tax=Collimonas pratensis TaxID=279113 RepID=A0A127Q6E0_9BURK|nr:hypothetical protein CPter91_3036 [Collimonas pratensis]
MMATAATMQTISAQSVVVEQLGAQTYQSIVPDWSAGRY